MPRLFAFSICLLRASASASLEVSGSSPVPPKDASVRVPKLPTLPNAGPYAESRRDTVELFHIFSLVECLVRLPFPRLFIMKGLYKVPTNVFGLGTGVLAFDVIAMTGILLSTVFAIGFRSKFWSRAWTLHLGMALLSLWCVLNWIDMVVRQASATVTYAYLLTDCFFTVIKVTSDVFVLWGVCKLMIRYEVLRGKSEHDTLWLLTGPLWFIGIYHVCLRFAFAISWLSFSDVHVIQGIAKAKNAFEITFIALQFVSYLGAFCVAVSMASKTSATRAPRAPSTTHHPNESVLGWCAVAIVCLGTRAFCEVITVGQLDRHPVHLNTILRARNVTYHLFSVAAFCALVFAVPFKSKSDDPVDPMLQDETDAIIFVRDQILNRLDQTTENGSKTAPSLSSILDEVRAVDERAEVHAEIRRLRKMFGGWEPIYIWNGDEPRVEEE